MSEVAPRSIGPRSNAIYATWFHAGALVIVVAGLAYWSGELRCDTMERPTLNLIGERLAAPPFLAVMAAEATRRLSGSAVLTWILSVAMLISSAWWVLTSESGGMICELHGL